MSSETVTISADFNRQTFSVQSNCLAQPRWPRRARELTHMSEGRNRTVLPATRHWRRCRHNRFITPEKCRRLQMFRNPSPLQRTIATNEFETRITVGDRPKRNGKQQTNRCCLYDSGDVVSLRYSSYVIRVRCLNCSCSIRHSVPVASMSLTCLPRCLCVAI